ncbi:large ribosomal subunit protein mL38 [Trichomonascus vanleenenianus]|uniref:mitochondrial 54S ribosomal protein mL38 MRPL35 n=1 Tax=Trichomonascus vanleenenianus TaxID=2268995 RepID=UPI003ECB3BB2
MAGARQFVRQFSRSLPRCNAESLKIRNPIMKKAVLEGEWVEGPPSLRTRRARLAYHSPIGLKEVFPLAHEVIKKDSERHYTEAAKLAVELEKTDNFQKKQHIKNELNKHLVRAELHNPEVLYNFQIRKPDFAEPIYRYLSSRDWKSYEMLLLLQRLETLHVIPDTMPTVNPRAQVKLQFPGVVKKYVEAGKVLRNDVCAKAPMLEVQEFAEITPGSLYTIVIVDPDTPDIPADSFKTTLHWAVANVPLSNTDHVFDPAKGTELVSYLPPHPEKNSPTHRYCVWVFRQAKHGDSVKPIMVPAADVARDKFNIRRFARTHGLEAVGAHVWRVNYDRSTDAVRAKYSLGPGKVYTRTRRVEVRQDLKYV